MADRSNMTGSQESLDAGQAQARRDDKMMMGKGCEQQGNMQRGMGHGDAMKNAGGMRMGDNMASSGNTDATKKSGMEGNNDNSTYKYGNHSLI